MISPLAILFLLLAVLSVKVDWSAISTPGLPFDLPPIQSDGATWADATSAVAAVIGLVVAVVALALAVVAWRAARDDLKIAQESLDLAKREYEDSKRLLSRKPAIMSSVQLVRPGQGLFDRFTPDEITLLTWEIIVWNDGEKPADNVLLNFETRADLEGPYWSDALGNRSTDPIEWKEAYPTFRVVTDVEQNDHRSKLLEANIPRLGLDRSPRFFVSARLNVGAMKNQQAFVPICFMVSGGDAAASGEPLEVCWRITLDKNRPVIQSIYDV